MFRIKWNNGINDCVTTYGDIFKRLDYCNAAMYEIEHTDSTHNAMQHTIHNIHYGFVSYDTPICSIRYWHDLDTNKDGYNITVNRAMYRCSNSTIHQFVRFLRYTVGDIITYQDIKEYDKRSGFNKDIAVASVCPIHIFWSDSDSMRYAMEQTGHAWYATCIDRS